MKNDDPLEHTLYDMDSAEARIAREASRYRTVIVAAVTALEEASKAALKDRAVAAALKVLKGGLE